MTHRAKHLNFILVATSATLLAAACASSETPPSAAEMGSEAVNANGGVGGSAPSTPETSGGSDTVNSSGGVRTPSTGGNNDGTGGRDAASQDTGGSNTAGQNAGGSNTAGQNAGGSNTAGQNAGGSASSSGGSAGETGVGGAASQTGPDPECLAMLEAANAFIGALGEPQKAETMFPWTDSERTAFEFLPPGNAARKGLTAKNLDAAQTAALDEFLQKALSQSGYDKVATIRQLEIALRNGDPEYRDPENYFISIFGEPNAEQSPWGWRFEGHHLSLHFSVVACRQYSPTPAFWGASGYANPAASPLRSEAELAQALFDSLGDLQGSAEAGEEGKKAIDAKKQKAEGYPASGASAAGFSAPQRAALLQLIRTYTDNMPAPVAEQRMQLIEAAGVDQITFLFKSNGYYRLQGPTFIIEHAPAGNNHVHAVWRDFDGDWGEDLLKRHMEQAHSGAQ